jgi:multiple sugar transport system ATP-binding protein
MRAELASIHRRTGTTAIYVTHDQVEAMTLGDRVAVLHNGVLQQVDSPKRLYDEPTNLFVAAFMGSPAMNLVHARVDGSNVRFGEYAFPVPTGTSLRWSGDVVLGIRPSAFSQDAGNGLPAIEVDVSMVEELGSEVHLLFNVAARAALPDVAAATTGDESEALEPSMLFSDEGSTPFTAIVSASSTSRPGDRVRLSVDPSQFHFFDPASGNAIGA